MSKFFAGASTAIIAALLLAGCSKSTSSGGTAPQLKAPTFAGPSSNSSQADTSTGASTAKLAAATFNAYAQGYLGLFSGNGTQNGNTWTWTITQGGETATWTATQSGSNYNWKLVLNGSSGSTTYNNWTALDGSETTDGKTGNWTLYNENSTIAAFSVSWTTASDGTLTGTIVINDSTGTQEEKEVFTNHPDKSGELVIYMGSASAAVKYLDVVWQANGSGTWTLYDITTGAVANTGTWS